ncbi:MerR family transcriptional regulator [Caproiciproducens sp. NJN-50]|uniref:MerR family transcriptional regulator n=1 Tax=Caproiciproducens sp. NJN-50 TaxID=2507162 RepID=UPI000FFE161A|nr:MerR family transcriptional regulator [Caproiciproducens sp. NJN-50]QAT50934.1 MerR family transcriptional regulator [Caproiciproducens sp. NJN-50]
MEYTINQLAKLAGVSTRTLRYYDQCGLLPPKTVRSNGYRIYGETEVNRLQQILFYRELGVELSEIGRILAEKDFDGLSALQNHLTALREKRARLDRLIGNVQTSISAMKGEAEMTDEEKFEGFKEKLISDNEQEYGGEIREKYGDEAVGRSNAKLKNMTKEQYDELEALTQELNNTLKAAFEQGDPGGELAQKACALHKRWLCFYWDHYSKEAHRGVAQMYVDDPRFTAYYDAIVPGCAVFLKDAVQIFCA